MSSVDAAWFRIDRPENAADVVALLAFDELPSVSRLRRLLEERLLSYARFRQRAVRGWFAGGDAWEDDTAFSLDRHLVTERLDPGEPRALQDLVSRVATEPLDPARPLWRIHLAGGERGGALVAKLSHCMGDGFALIGLLLALGDEREEAPAAQHTLPAARRLAPWLELGSTLRSAAAHPLRAAALAGESAALAASLARMIALPADPPTMLSRPLTGHRRAAWSGGVSLERIRTVARCRGATVNDVLVAALAGALRSVLARAGERVDAMPIRALVPVNLRPGPPTPGPSSLGNRFGLVFLELPVDAPTAEARFEAVRARTAAMKGRPDAVATLGVLAGLGRFPAVEPWAARFFSRKASLVLTNVPGPRLPLHLAGSRIDHAMFWVPHPSTLGLGVSILSYAGEVRIGVRADAGVMRRPEDLVESFEVELASLFVNGAPEPQATRRVASP